MQPRSLLPLGSLVSGTQNYHVIEKKLDLVLVSGVGGYAFGCVWGLTARTFLGARLPNTLFIGATIPALLSIYYRDHLRGLKLR